jgi:hypothetical protein
MIKRVGSIRANLEASLSPFRSTKKRFRLPPRRPLKWCPSLTAAASGRRIRLILTTLIGRRFLASARLELRDQPNNADHQEHRPRRNKPRQDEKHDEYSEAVHGCSDGVRCCLLAFLLASKSASHCAICSSESLRRSTCPSTRQEFSAATSGYFFCRATSSERLFMIIMMK